MENTPVTQPPKLLDQIRNKLRVKHYAIRTEEQYLHWIKRYILFHAKRHPKEMGAAKIEAFLTHLANGEGRSAALRFAQRAMMDSKERSHPYYWAAFVPIGNWVPLPQEK